MYIQIIKVDSWVPYGITEKYLSQKFSESCPRSYLLDVNGSIEYIFKRLFFAERR